MQANPITTKVKDGGAGVPGSGAAVTLMLQLLVVLPAAESWTPATKDVEPTAPGDPAIAPVEAVRLNPDGSDPVIENVYGGVPPVDTSKEL